MLNHTHKTTIPMESDSVDVYPGTYPDQFVFSGSTLGDPGAGWMVNDRRPRSQQGPVRPRGSRPRFGKYRCLARMIGKL